MRSRDVAGMRASAIAFGAMPLTMRAEKPAMTDERAVYTVHAALDAGITVIDTADTYNAAAEWNDGERLIRRALASWSGDREAVIVASKAGFVRQSTMMGRPIHDGGWGVDGRPQYIRAACEKTLRALGVEYVDLYQSHCPDPHVDYAETIGAFAELRAEGKIAHVGICNVTAEQVDIARAVLDGRLASVQNQFSPRHTKHYPLIELCQRYNMMFLPWACLGGVDRAGSLGDRHPEFAQVARERGVSPQQVCLAWELRLAPVVVPIPGGSRPESVRDSAAAAELELSDAEFLRLSAPLAPFQRLKTDDVAADVTASE